MLWGGGQGLTRFLLVARRSKLLAARKKDVGHGSGAGCRADC